MDKTRAKETPDDSMAKLSHDNVPMEYQDSEGYKEVLPLYREELEFNNEVGTFRDRAIKDEKALLELNDEFNQDAVGEPIQLTDSDLIAPSDEEMLAEALSFAKRRTETLKLSTGRAPRLEKPIVVPQVRNGVGVPFTRAFSEALTTYDVTQAEWLGFLDNLNVVATANPPLQVLDLVGNVIGFIPHEWAMAAGTAICAVAQVGTYIVSKQRTERFMARANDEFFAPRGLKATLCTTEALYKIIGLLPEDAESSSSFPSIPFLSRDSSSRVRLAPLDNSTIHPTIHERRLKAVEPYVAPLTFDVPPPAPQTTTLRKICAWQVKRDAKQAEKRLLKARQRKQQRQGNWQSPASSISPDPSAPERRAIKMDISPPVPIPVEGTTKPTSTSSKAAVIGITALSMIIPLPNSMTSKSSRHEERTNRAWKRYERDVSRGQGAKAESKYNKEMGKIEKKSNREMEKLEKGDKEEKAHRKILWVLVQNLVDDAI